MVGDCSSLSRDDLVLRNCDISADVSKVTGLIGLRLVSPDSLSERERSLVVIGQQLAFSDSGVLSHSSYGWVQRVKPSSLDIGGALRITGLSLSRVAREVLSS